MVKSQRHKYGFFIHPQVKEAEAVARRYCDELVLSFGDAIAPELGSVEVRWQFSIVRVDDSVVFSVEHRPERLQLITDDQNGPVRQGLLEVLDWWNGETILIAPEGKGLEWDTHALPNAWSNPWQDGLQLQTITQYPTRLGKRVLEEWNPGLVYVPFELHYTLPTREEEAAAMNLWLEKQHVTVTEAVALLTPEPTGPWFFALPQRYRSALAPLSTGLKAVGSQEQAELAAQEYRGPCFLVEQHTGKVLSRWAER